jgi:hypothetical protein
MDHSENNTSNKTYIAACVFVAMAFLLNHYQAMTDNTDTLTAGRDL